MPCAWIDRRKSEAELAEDSVRTGYISTSQEAAELQRKIFLLNVKLHTTTIFFHYWLGPSWEEYDIPHQSCEKVNTRSLSVKQTSHSWLKNTPWNSKWFMYLCFYCDNQECQASPPNTAVWQLAMMVHKVWCWEPGPKHSFQPWNTVLSTVNLHRFRLCSPLLKPRCVILINV